MGEDARAIEEAIRTERNELGRNIEAVWPGNRDRSTEELAHRKRVVREPSVPLALNPDGAFAVGIKVGRRSMDLLLVDFTGAVRERWSTPYRHPDPDVTPRTRPRPAAVMIGSAARSTLR